MTRVTGPILVAVSLAVGQGGGAEAQGRYRWRIPFYGSQSRPVAADGIVYVGSSRGELHALELASGRTVWVHPTGVNLPFSGPMIVSGEGEMAGARAMLGHTADPWPARRVINAAPVVDQGIVFMASEDRVFYALDARSGALRWRLDLPRAATGATVAGGRVFLTAGNAVLAYEPNGRRVWSYELFVTLPDDARRAPSVPVVVGDAVYVAAHVTLPAGDPLDRNVLVLVALDRTAGTERWTYRANSSRVPDPLIAEGLVFLTATYPEALHAIDATTGVRRWVFGAPDCARNVSDPIVSGGRVLFATDCGIYGLVPATGQVAWSAAGRWVPYLLAASPPHAPLVLAVDFPDKRLHALDGITGQARWTSGIDSEVRPLAVGDSIVYGGSGSSFIGLDHRSGKTLWRRNAGAEPSSGPLLIDGAACFTSGVAFTRLTFGFEPVRGWLACVDAASGKP